MSTELEISETRDSLLEASNTTANFVILNALAATVATYGLFANSPAVVIGAMIIAMLLSPISSLALGIVDSNATLIGKSLRTLFVGVATVCLSAAFWGIVNIKSPITGEIMARTSPNFMDLMIALAGGAAGAYSLIHKRLGSALVGVAIATALVPPLASATVLLIHGEYALSRGAFLLTFTNIVGIQFGYALVLWLKGISNVVYDPIKGSRTFLRRNALGLGLMVALGVFLTYNLLVVVGKFNFENDARNLLTRDINGLNGSHLAEVRFDEENNRMVVRAVMRGPQAPSPEVVARMEDHLPANYRGIPNELRIRFVKTEVITRSGELFNDNAK